MKTRITLAFLMTMLAVNLSAAEVDKAELEARMKLADTVLNDDSFYQKWNKPGLISTPEIAREVKKEADEATERIEHALEDRRAWCNTRFFVNSCLDDARKISFQRSREIRQIVVKAEEVLRKERMDTIREHVEEQRAKKSDPVKINKSHVKPRAEPVDMSPAFSGAAPSQTDSLEREAQEKANVEAYEKKQREALKRMQEAESKAQKRRADREEHAEKLNETMKARLEAQKRYEEKKDERESGLSKYF